MQSERQFPDRAEVTLFSFLISSAKCECTGHPGMLFPRLARMLSMQRRMLSREECPGSSEILGEDVSKIFPALISVSSASCSNPF